MIKPKYPKQADVSQIARSIVEHATGEPLTPLASDSPKIVRTLKRHESASQSRKYKAKRPK